MTAARCSAAAHFSWPFSLSGHPEETPALQIPELGHLLRAKAITAMELTKIYLARLKK